jgi:peptide/nickel transport system substrate-binding protein
MVLVAWVGSSVTAEQPAVFVLVDQMEPAHIDPGRTIDAYTLRVFKAIYEPLLSHIPGTQYELAPALGTSWEIAEDGLSYTFQLRQGVKFHDGTDFNAYDVKASFDRVIALNAAPRTFVKSLASVEVLGEYTVKFALSARDIYFTQGLPFVFIISADALTTHGVDGDLARGWLAQNEAGTGPYTLESWVKADGIRLRTFGDYWDSVRPAFEKVYLQVVPDTTTQRLLLESGDAHAVARVFAADLPSYRNNPNIKVQQDQLTSNYIIALNASKDPTSDIRVRQALIAAYPYQEVMDIVFPGIMQRGVGPLAIAMPHAYVMDPLPQTDLALAKSLFAGAGFGSGLTLQMFVVDLAEQRRMAVLFQNNLAQVGVTLEVQYLAWARMVEVMSNPATAPHISVLHASLPSADEAYALWTYFGKGAYYNWCYYDNPEVDRLLAEARTQATTEEAGELVRQAQEIIVADATAIYGGCQLRTLAMRSEICGYETEPNGVERALNFKDFYWCAE